jgi:hypothetical protein
VYYRLRPAVLDEYVAELRNRMAVHTATSGHEGTVRGPNFSA